MNDHSWLDMRALTAERPRPAKGFRGDDIAAIVVLLLVLAGCLL